MGMILVFGCFYGGFPRYREVGVSIGGSSVTGQWQSVVSKKWWPLGTPGIYSVGILGNSLLATV